MLNREETTTVLLNERISLTAYFSTIVRNYHMAEDIFQELCVKCIVRDESFESPVHLLNWARLAGKNRAIDLIRSRDGKHVGLSDATLEKLALGWDIQSEWGKRDQLESLRHCLNKLSEEKLELLRLRHFEGRSGLEISEQLGRNLKTVYQTLARIHKSLAECVAAKLESLSREST